MFTGIMPERVAKMSPREHRLFDNIKKAFSDCDADIGKPEMADYCIETLLKGIDAAKKLRLMLLDRPLSENSKNKKEFIDFLELEIPKKSNGARTYSLRNQESMKSYSASISEMIYAIRCMIHENENLDESESPDYHIRLRWTGPQRLLVQKHDGESIIINGRVLLLRLREILSKFITILAGLESLSKGKSFSATIHPRLYSIQPSNRRRRMP